jgi:IclR family transcriptional regulator, KDG regulon repressor
MRKDTMKSLRKSLDILKLFLNQKSELSLTEIIKLSGLNKSTAGRIAAVLVEYNFLKQPEKRNKYSLGPIFLSFAGTIKSGSVMREIALPYVQKLTQQVHESVVIAYGDEMKNVFTETFHDISSTKNILRVGIDEGTGLPPHTNSLGKIILANMPNDAMQRYLEGKPLERFTPNTITDVSLLKNHLMTIRKEGIAFDEGEHEIGVSGIAAGIKDAECKIKGAIAVIAPSARLTREKMEELVPVIKQYAIEISHGLGYQAGKNNTD